jgi:hypothetical protein
VKSVVNQICWFDFFQKNLRACFYIQKSTTFAVLILKR